MTVQDRPVRVPDFVATILKTVGVNPTRRINVRDQPIGVVDGEARPLDELTDFAAADLASNNVLDGFTHPRLI